MIFEHVSTLVLSSQNCSFSDSFFLVRDTNSLTVVDPLNERWAIKLFFERVLGNLRDLGSSELCHKELLHLVSDVLVLGFAGLSSLNGKKLIVKVDGIKSFDVVELSLALVSLSLVVSESFVLSRLHGSCAEAISDVSHDDEHEETSEGDVGLPLFHDSIKKYYVEPDVSKDRPDGSDSKDTGVLNFLHTNRGSIFLALLLGSVIVSGADRVD